MEVFFIHWNERELKEKTGPLKKAGYKVKFHYSSEKTADLKDNLPDVLVICLDRLPSHGKAWAAWMWEARKRQHIPIVFCGGKPEKVGPFRTQFPNAVFCSNETLLPTLEKLK